MYKITEHIEKQIENHFHWYTYSLFKHIKSALNSLSEMSQIIRKSIQIVEFNHQNSDNLDIAVCKLETITNN